MNYKSRLVFSILCLSLIDAPYAQPNSSDAVEFVSMSYVTADESPFGRDHDIVQLSTKVYSTGFVDYGVIGGSGSRPLPEFPCTNENEFCWISLLPKLVAVYPRACFPRCGEWEAYGFKFRQDAVRYVRVGGYFGPAITYIVQAPNGEIQFQLVTQALGLIGFSDFSPPGRDSPLPIYWREASSRLFFPFESNGIAAPIRNYSGFEAAFGMTWERALVKRPEAIMEEVVREK